MSFYDNSPGMVDDIPRSPPAAPAARTPTPAAAVPLLGDAPGVELISEDEAAARRVYDKMRPTAAPAPAQPGELRFAPLAEPTMPYGPNVENEVRSAAEASGLPQQDAVAAGQHWVQIFHAHGIPDGEVSRLVDAGRAIAAGIPDEATTETTWPQQAQERLRAEFGPGNVDHTLQLCRRYVAQHPALDNYLTATRLGNHPAVVASIAGVARRAWQAGKLK